MFLRQQLIDPGSVTLKGLPLKLVLREAFKVPMDRIEGPSWLDTDCFEIAAKIPEGATSDQLPAMYQALLAERFKLAAHIQDRPSPGYALVVDKGGPKFKEDDPNKNFVGAGRSGMVMFGAFGHGAVKGVRTMAALAANLSTEGYGPVQDLTGLTGKYDIDLRGAGPRPRIARPHRIGSHAPDRGRARADWNRPVCRRSGPAWIETGAPADAGPIPGNRPYRADSD